MQEKILSYNTDDVKVTWDIKRCIHAEECVRGLPGVFDSKSRPWIKPDLAGINELTEVIERCPTGALHYELKNTAETEQPPSQNVITIQKDGPIYIYGNVVIRDSDDKVVLKDTRVAMCRCGASKNKPLCDNSHIDAKFNADASYNVERLRTEPVQGKGGELSVKVLASAPFVVEGNYDLTGGDTGTETCSKKMSFCRCGGSQTKPFCDGSHKEIGFISDS